MDSPTAVVNFLFHSQNLPGHLLFVLAPPISSTKCSPEPHEIRARQPMASTPGLLFLASEKDGIAYWVFWKPG